MVEPLHHVFTATAAVYCQDPMKIEKYWTEIVKAHTHKSRYYHDLYHLDCLLDELECVKDQIEDWETMAFAVFYHDLVYNPMRSDNEEKSAIRAAARLTDMGFPKGRVLQCADTINATKSHAVSDSNDINFFMDADLSILGSAYDTYELYFHNIRREYRWFPDIIYLPGRKKVLRHFLQMGRIFKTEFFFDRYELQARANLERELRLLGEKA
jgi:predicted metal-dependent HD superfamily phosphohydrolase